MKKQKTNKKERAKEKIKKKEKKKKKIQRKKKKEKERRKKDTTKRDVFLTIDRNFYFIIFIILPRAFSSIPSFSQLAS